MVLSRLPESGTEAHQGRTIREPGRGCGPLIFETRPRQFSTKIYWGISISQTTAWEASFMLLAVL